MNPNPIIVRGITITLSPLPRFRPCARGQFVAVFDEKPIGRTMESHFQRALKLTGEADFRKPKDLAIALGNHLQDKVVLSPDFGLVITSKTQRDTRQVPLRIRDDLTSAIARELRSLTAPAS